MRRKIRRRVLRYLRTTGRLKDLDAAELWFAPGVGIVKRVVRRDGKDVHVAELAAFTPGKPDSDPEAVLARFLQRDAGKRSQTRGASAVTDP